MSRSPSISVWSVWQYDDDAAVDGIAGPVDLNVLSGTLAEFLERP